MADPQAVLLLRWMSHMHTVHLEDPDFGTAEDDRTMSYAQFQDQICWLDEQWQQYCRTHPVIDLSQANLNGVVLNCINLPGANCRGAVFCNARLEGVSFQNADLTNARFDGAFLKSMDKINFAGANCQGAVFCNARLGNVSFQNANIAGARFDKALLGDSGWVDFTGANLRGTRFDGATFNGVDIRGAKNLHMEQVFDAFDRNPSRVTCSPKMRAALLRMQEIQTSGVEAQDTLEDTWYRGLERPHPFMAPSEIQQIGRGRNPEEKFHKSS